MFSMMVVVNDRTHSKCKLLFCVDNGFVKAFSGFGP